MTPPIHIFDLISGDPGGSDDHKATFLQFKLTHVTILKYQRDISIKFDNKNSCQVLAGKRIN